MRSHEGTGCVQGGRKARGSQAAEGWPAYQGVVGSLLRLPRSPANPELLSHYNNYGCVTPAIIAFSSSLVSAPVLVYCQY